MLTISNWYKLNPIRHSDKDHPWHWLCQNYSSWLKYKWKEPYYNFPDSPSRIEEEKPTYTLRLKDGQTIRHRSRWVIDERISLGWSMDSVSLFYLFLEHGQEVWRTLLLHWLFNNNFIYILSTMVWYLFLWTSRKICMKCDKFSWDFFFVINKVRKINSPFAI